MKGLIIKDFYVLQKTLKTYGVFIVVYGIFGAVTNQGSFVSGMLGVMLAMLPITAIAYDERAKWDKYALTMPVSKKDLVLSKYALGLILAGIGMVLSFAILSFTVDNTFMENIFIVFCVSGIGLIYQAMVLPIMFKFGTEKGRLYMMAGMFLPIIIIVIVSKLGFSISYDTIMFFESIANLLPFIAAGVVGLIYIASIMVSLKFYDSSREV